MALTRREFLKLIPSAFAGFLFRDEKLQTVEPPPSEWAFPLAFPARFLTPDELMTEKTYIPLVGKNG